MCGPQKYLSRTPSKILMKLISKLHNSKELERKNGHSQMETDKTYVKEYLSKEDTKSAILALSPKQPREGYCSMKQQPST